MEFAPAGVPLSFEVTYDRDDLVVGMSVFDDTGLSPVLVQGPAQMSIVAGFTYRAKFTALDGHNYIVIKGVYTDLTFTELDLDYSMGSESVVAQAFNSNSNGSACLIVGIVEETPDVIGVVEC